LLDPSPPPPHEEKSKMTFIQTLNLIQQIATALAVACVLFATQAYAGPREAVLSVYQRLSGVPLVDEAKIGEYVAAWSTGDRASVAKAATSSETFTNITAVNFAIPIAYRDHSPHNGLNDVVATVAGILRDDLDARTMLTGTFRYQGDAALYTVNNRATYSLANNTHYSQLETANINLFKVLTQVPQSFPVAAGVVTLRGWLLAHADAGTNRRMISELMFCFLGLQMEQIADNTLSQGFIGRDVDRSPGGDTSLFLGTCAGCHAGMDGLRGATAKISFVNNTPVYADNNPPAGEFDANGIAVKMNRNANFFPAGYFMTTDNWVNLWKGSAAMGFPADAPASGMGLASLTALLAQADAFARNMAKRAFKTVCLRDLTPGESSLVDYLADGFKASDYKLKALFESIALRPECSLIN
jgi:hypothetical protein